MSKLAINVKFLEAIKVLKEEASPKVICTGCNKECYVVRKNDLDGNQSELLCLNCQGTAYAFKLKFAYV